MRVLLKRLIMRRVTSFLIRDILDSVDSTGVRLESSNDHHHRVIPCPLDCLNCHFDANEICLRFPAVSFHHQRQDSLHSSLTCNNQSVTLLPWSPFTASGLSSNGSTGTGIFPFTVHSTDRVTLEQQQNDIDQQLDVCSQGDNDCDSNRDTPVSHLDSSSRNNSVSSSQRKIRRNRTVFTELQLMGLERRFDSQKYLSTPDRADLARVLGLTQLQVKTWYQNRRMKWKKQVMQGGCLIPPTKPKGRPKKNSIPSLGILDSMVFLAAATSSNPSTATSMSSSSNT